MDSPHSNSPPHSSRQQPELSSIVTPPRYVNPNSLDDSISQDQQHSHQGMLTSPSFILRFPSFSKRKKAKQPRQIKKYLAMEKTYQTLKENLTAIPFSPSIILYFFKHQNLLTKLGLWDFVHIDFGKTVRTELIAQLVSTYDSKARCSYVNGFRILVNRADLGRALKLPVKKEKGTGVGEGVEVDLDLLTEESIGFIENLVSYWMLLHEDTWMMPGEVLHWMTFIKDGYPEKVDWAGLLWFMVEKELTKGERLVDCYYASHLQYLIMSQHRELCLVDEPDKVELEGEKKEVVVGVAKERCLQADCTYEVQEKVHVRVESETVDLVGEETKADVDVDVDVEIESEKVEFVGEGNKADEVDVVVESERVDSVEEANKAEEVDVGVESESERVDLVEEETKADVDVEIGSEKVEFVGEGNKADEVDVVVESERVDLVEEANKVEEVDVGVESEMVDLVEEANEAESGEGSLEVDSITAIQKEDVDVPERLNIELTLGESTGAEEIVEEEKVLDAEMMDLEEGNEHANDEWQLDADNTLGEHSLQRCNMGIRSQLFNYEDIKDEAEDIEEEGGEEADDTFDILENHDMLVSDGLTSNFLQAMQANKLPFSSHEQFHGQPGIGLVASRNDMQHNSLAGPSFYGNGGKRATEHMSENCLDDNNKRLRTDAPWNNEPPNFMMCVDGMQQFITRATMIYEAKEQSLEQSNMNQQILLNEVQKRDSIIEHLHKSRSKEMQKKDEEIYRLERELYVMENLLHGYRDALKETQKAFADHKKQFALPEESIYKDAGPRGLMLTTEAIEKRQLKQQEDHTRNCLMLEQMAKEAEEGYASQFESLLEKVRKLDSRLVSHENEMIELKNSSRNRKGRGAKQPICSKTSMPDSFEQPGSSETAITDNCEGMEDEEPAYREPSMLEQPTSSDTDMTDN